MGRASTVCILAAGKSTRFLSSGPKVLQPVCGRPLLGWVLDQARALEPERIVVVVGHKGDEVRERIQAEAEGGPEIVFVTQTEQKGTGHAVQVAFEHFADAPGPAVVLYGDMPLLRADSLRELVTSFEAHRAAAVTAVAERPRGFGRILRGEDGAFRGIVEEKDATEEQRRIREVNVGVYAFAREDLAELLPGLRADNAQGELYLTDLLGAVIERGGSVGTVTLEDEAEGIGINTLEHLTEARRALQERILLGHMENGVLIEDPATTYIDAGVEIGPGTRILPCTVIRGGVRIGAGCEVGPFTHLRKGTVLEDGAEVGNFTESKNSTIGAGTKAKHLSYLGDADIGAGANVGAGTIFANYDGKAKHRTVVGDRAFIGSGTTIVAPNTLGEGSTTGAGCVVTRSAEVGPGETWVGIPARRLGEGAPAREDRSEGAAD